MIYHEFKHEPVDWKKLHKKVVVVHYYAGGPEVLEPEMVTLYDPETSITYVVSEKWWDEKSNPKRGK